MPNRYAWNGFLWTLTGVFRITRVIRELKQASSLTSKLSRVLNLSQAFLVSPRASWSAAMVSFCCAVYNKNNSTNSYSQQQIHKDNP